MPDHPIDWSRAWTNLKMSAFVVGIIVCYGLVASLHGKGVQIKDNTEQLAMSRALMTQRFEALRDRCDAQLQALGSSILSNHPAYAHERQKYLRPTWGHRDR